jgi:hypothetical protein
METGSLVLVSCAAPREKFWGVLIGLSPVVGKIRGVKLFELY